MDKKPSQFIGHIHKLGDTSIYVYEFALYPDELKSVEIHVSDIWEIKTRRKGTVGKGILIGAGLGFAIGGLIGSAIGDTRRKAHTGGLISFAGASKRENIGIGATSGAILGVGFGAIFGSARLSIPINYNVDKYKYRKNDLQEYVLKP